MPGTTRSKYERNEQGVLVRSGDQQIRAQAMPVVQIKHSECVDLINMLERPEGAMFNADKEERCKLAGVRPAYDTDADLGKRFNAYKQEAFEFSDDRNQFEHYGAGLHYNAQAGRMAHGTMGRMNAAAVQEAPDLFASFLNDANKFGAQEKAQPSWAAPIKPANLAPAEGTAPAPASPTTA